MSTHTQNRLWRVEWHHRDGYQAPYNVVEAKDYKDAHSLVKKSGNRLLDFPKSWSFKTVALPYVYNGTRWIEPKRA